MHSATLGRDKTGRVTGEISVTVNATATVSRENTGRVTGDLVVEGPG